MLEVMKVVGVNGGIVLVHAEDDELVRHIEVKLASDGRDQWYNLKSRRDTVQVDWRLLSTEQPMASRLRWKVMVWS
jgi:dihydroorotase-like cyclic amidohydrolase